MTTSSADERQTDWSVLPVALAFGFGMGAVGWWLTKDEPVETPGAVMARVDGVPPPAAGPGLPPRMAPAGPSVGARSSLAQASVVAPAGAGGGVRSAPALPPASPPNPVDAEFGPPLQPPLTARPPFMNANEWSVLLAAAQQMAQPEADTAMLANQLRFRRLLKRWRDAPSGMPGGTHLRARAAQALLDELRPRLASGHLSLAEARQLLPDLLADAVADPAERIERAQAMANALNQASQAHGESGGTPSP